MVPRAPQGTLVTPLARRLAALTGVDLSAAEASVRARSGRRVRAADITAMRETPQPSPASGKPRPVPPLVAAGAPLVAQSVEADFSAAESALAAVGGSRSPELAHLAILARAVCLAIAEFPLVNSSVDAGRLIVHGRIDLLLQLSRPDETPAGRVITDAARLKADRIYALLTDPAAPPDRPTYAIEAFSATGRIDTAPLPTVPAAAVLAADRVRRRAVVRNVAGSDVMTIRPVMLLTQRFDHRAFDGAYSASFLGGICRHLAGHDWAHEIAPPGR